MLYCDASCEPTTIQSVMQSVRSPRSTLAVAMACLLAVSAAAADLTVSAAASLTNAFHELGPAFERANPGTKVLLNFGASGALLQQISKGAPVDVFASADQETMDQAQTSAWCRPIHGATSCPTHWW